MPAEALRLTEKIDAFDKLALEAKFQKLSPGGAISYVEVPNMQNNLKAVLSIMKFIYENIMYAELNTKSDYCQVCGFDGEIEIVKDESGKLMPEVRQHRRVQAQRRPPHLRLHRLPVLEPGPYAGNQGTRAARLVNYASIRTCDIANGEGVRVSLFVSGCTHHCKGCFNEEAWDFAYGEPFTREIEDKLLVALAPSHIAGLTILGGEPMEPENQRALVPFLRRVRDRFGLSKTIWIYTGCILEKELKAESRWRTEVTDEILAMTDVLVDGRFVEELKDISLQFRGSSNQRIINLR